MRFPRFTGFKRFPFQKPTQYQVPFPMLFDDTLTQLQKMNKLIHLIQQLEVSFDELIEAIDEVLDSLENAMNGQDEKIETLRQEFEKLKQDVMNEIVPENLTNILNEWLASGKLADILNGNVFTNKQDKTSVLVSQFGDETNFSIIQQAIDWALTHGYKTVILDSPIYYADIPTIQGKGINLISYIRSELDYTSMPINNQGSPMIQYTGELQGNVYQLTADAPFMSKQISVSDGSAFSIGDMIQIWTENNGRGVDAWNDSSVAVRRGEIVEVTNVEGNLLTLAEPLMDKNGYLVSDVVSIQKVFMLSDCSVNGLVLKGHGRQPSAEGDWGIQMRYVKNAKVTNCTLNRVDRMGVEFIGCHTYYCSNNVANHDPQGSNGTVNYSFVTTACSRHGVFSGNKARNSRHGFTTSHISSAHAHFVPGISRFTVVENNEFMNTWHAGISHHNDTEYMTIRENTIVNCFYGIEVRERNIRVIDNNILASSNHNAIYLNKNPQNAFIHGNNIEGGFILVSGLFADYPIQGVVISGNNIANVNDIACINVNITTGSLLGLLISKNTIHDMVGTSTNARAIYVGGNVSGLSDGNSINNIQGNGIRIGSGTKDFVISNNKFENITQYAMAIDTATYQNLYANSNIYSQIGQAQVISGLSHLTANINHMGQQITA